MTDIFRNAHKRPPLTVVMNKVHVGGPGIPMRHIVLSGKDKFRDYELHATKGYRSNRLPVVREPSARARAIMDQLAKTQLAKTQLADNAAPSVVPEAAHLQPWQAAVITKIAPQELPAQAPKRWT